MEVSIFSKELVKPSTLVMKPPLKLNLLDQLTPASYSPAILFFRNNSDISHISNRLKQSLSQTLSDYYPLAGRVRDNFAIHDFHEGVPFLETRVSCHMSDFLHDQGSGNNRVGLLNNLLPVRAECLVEDSGPQVAVQLNVFECGGLAIGLCSSHKSHDGTVMGSFVASWATNYRHVSGPISKKTINPNFSEGVLAFPPVTTSIPLHYISLSEGLWFGSGGEPVTRRFVFDSESVSKLRLKAESRNLENPTRAEALSAFIWKSTISASASHAKHDYPSSSLMCQAVDLRRLIRPRLSRHSFGNLILTSNSKYDASGGVNGNPGVDDLARLARNAMSRMNNEFLEPFMGRGNGSGAMFDYLDRQTMTANEVASILNVSCWHGFGLSKIDFGLGPAVWVALSGPGVSGKEDFGVKYTSDTVILVENNNGGIEAWLTLGEPGVMKALENDPEFLEFASTKSLILPNT